MTHLLYIFDLWTDINVPICLDFKSLNIYLLLKCPSYVVFFLQFKYYCNSCFLSDKLNIYLFFSWFVAFSVSVLPVLVPPMCISMHSNYPSLYEKVTCIVTPTFPFPGRTVIIWKYSNIPLLTIISRTASGIY